MKARIIKAGVRRGQAHYALECVGCPTWYGRNAVLAIAGLSKEGAQLAYAQHVAAGHEPNRWA